MKPEQQNTKQKNLLVKFEIYKDGKFWCAKGIEEDVFTPQKRKSKPKNPFVIFKIYNNGKFWCAKGIEEDIFTQEKTLDELVKNIKEAVGLHFDEDYRYGGRIIVLSISGTDLEKLGTSDS